MVKLNPQIADTMAREEARMRDLFGGGEKEQNVEGEEGEANQKALLSGDDKGTSSSDEEIDIEKLVSTEVIFIYIYTNNSRPHNQNRSRAIQKAN